MGRTRPNKWWIEPCPQHPARIWKEWAYATDDKRQHYYCERWEHLSSQDNNNAEGQKDTTAEVRRIAFRKLTGRDGIIIVIGEYFNYILDRSNVDSERYQAYATGSLVGTVDAALQANDLDAARAWLSIQGGHGRINNNGEWKIERSIEFWKEGELLFGPNHKDEVQITGTAIENCQLVWNQESWEVFETNLSTVEEIRALFSPTTIVQTK
jgi:hypothetical protein